jgi:hypothetical protein
MKIKYLGNGVRASDAKTIHQEGEVLNEVQHGASKFQVVKHNGRIYSVYLGSLHGVAPKACRVSRFNESDAQNLRFS